MRPSGNVGSGSGLGSPRCGVEGLFCLAKLKNSINSIFHFLGVFVPAVRNQLHSAHGRSEGLGVDVYKTRFSPGGRFLEGVAVLRFRLTHSPLFVLHGNCLSHWHWAFEEMHFLSQPKAVDSPPQYKLICKLSLG